MKNMRKSILVTALGLALCAGTAQAALQAVDPGPYTAATGFFPQWYQDGTSLTLDLCLSKAESPNVPGALLCNLLPNPGVFDPAQPIVFPTNFPDEAFYFTADANVVGQGIDLIYIAHLEAAFAAGLPAPGDQVTFSRIRVRADFDVTVPTPGTYRITHPYGTEIFTVLAPGRRVINATRDIGIGAPGDFAGALAGDIGPFLRPSTVPGGLASPFITAVNPETGATEEFIGDPNVLQFVTGGQGGVNEVRIQRINPQGNPVGDINVATDQFFLSGRVFNNQPPTPVTVDRASYSRAADGTIQIDAFATSSAAASVCFRETLELANGTDACTTTMTGDNAGKFYGQNPAAPVVPAFIVVTASDTTANTAPTSIAQSLADVLRVSRAQYAKDTRALTVVATSSDKAVPPKITAVGLGVLTPGACALGLQRLSTVLPAEPPAFLTLVSSGGGRQTEPVTVVATATAAPNTSVPVAVADSATTNEEAPVTIPVLANDTDADCDVLSVTAVTQGTNGATVTTNGTTVTYSPRLNFFGTDTFTYTVSDGVNSATAAVTVTVNNVNDAPVANPDPGFTTNQATALTILDSTLLANDSDVDNVAPTPANTGLTIANFNVQGLAGTLVRNAGSVTVTPNAGFSGVTSFSYQVRDAAGALSNFAAVTITVNQTNVAPVIVSTPVTTATVGVQYTYDVNATDTAGQTLTYALTQAPAGMTINATTGLITWTPAAGQVGPNPVTVRVTDNGTPPLSATQSFTVTVNPAVVIDLDIDRLSVPNNVRRPATISPSLVVRNNGAVNQLRPARIIGVTQAGVVFYDQTVQVSDAPGGGATVVNFPTSQSTTVAGPGVITWTATIDDTDPDVDQATATTTVR